MRRGLQFVVALVSVLVLSGFAAGVVTTQAKTAAIPPTVGPMSSGSSSKFHVAEVFTGQWCGPCGNADPELSRLADEWTDNLIILNYHCCTTAPTSGNYDPFFDSTVTGVRDTWYGWQYLPSVVIDGGGTTPSGPDPLFVIGGFPSRPANYDMYTSALGSADSSSEISVSIAGDLRPDRAVATITVRATDAVPETNLYLRTVLYEDGRYLHQNSGPYVHRNIARGLNQVLLGTGTLMAGQTVTTTVQFMFPPSNDWQLNKLGIAAFVQSNTQHSVMDSSNTYGPYPVADILNAANYEDTP